MGEALSADGAEPDISNNIAERLTPAARQRGLTHRMNCCTRRPGTEKVPAFPAEIRFLYLSGNTRTTSPNEVRTRAKASSFTALMPRSSLITKYATEPPTNCRPYRLPTFVDSRFIECGGTPHSCSNRFETAKPWSRRSLAGDRQHHYWLPHSEPRLGVPCAIREELIELPRGHERPLRGTGTNRVMEVIRQPHLIS